MICPKCNSEIKDGSKFCTNCGEPLPKTKKCIQCGAFIKEDALFCTNCGTKQSVKEEKSTVSEPKVKHKESVISETKKKLKDENDWDSILFFLKNKIKWTIILCIICFVTITYLKMNKKSNKIEEYQQEYVSASPNGNVVQNDKDDDFEPITLEEFYNDYVFGNKDFSKIANKVCTPRLLQYLKDAYEYECEDGECYAMWLFRSGNQDGTSDECRVVNVKDEGDGWVGVFFIDMGIKDTIYIRFVQYNGQKLMDEIWK